MSVLYYIYTDTCGCIPHGMWVLITGMHKCPPALSGGVGESPPAVTQKKPVFSLWVPSGKLTCLWKITIFNGEIHHKWSFSIAMLNYQRVNIGKRVEFIL